MSILRDWEEDRIRKGKQMVLLAALAVLTTVFSLGFFFGRRSLPYEIAVQTEYAVQSQPVQETTVPQESSQENEAAEETNIVDLNTASLEELMTLPRIGQTLAQRILDYRAQYGKFSAPEQLMDVDGIGETTYEGLKDLITVEDPK